MHKDDVIALGEAAATTFMLRHKLNDRHPRVCETFNYADAGVRVTIAADGAANTWNIEISADGVRVAIAISHTATRTDATIAAHLDEQWSLFHAALSAAARGVFIIEVAPRAA